MHIVWSVVLLVYQQIMKNILNNSMSDSKVLMRLVPLSSYNQNIYVAQKVALEDCERMILHPEEG
jgi:hypothetical protein